MTEVLGRQLPMAAISNAVLLTDEEKARILALPRKEFDVAVTRTIWDERDAVSQLVGPGGTMGPIPSSFLSTAHRDALKPAVTYAFRFANKDVWKVGWTHDLKARLDDINKHVPHEALGGQCWKGWLIQEWASAQQAYDMEQRVLSECEGSSKYGERVHCSEDLFQQLWVKARKM